MYVHVVANVLVAGGCLLVQCKSEGFFLGFYHPPGKESALT